MRFSTETRSGEFPAVFERFEKTIGDNIWRRRAGKIRDDIRGNPYLREWLLEENRIAFALSAFSTGKEASGMLPAVQIQDTRQYETVALVTQTMAFLDAVDAQVAKAFIGRVKGAFSNPPDFRGLSLEMLTATHLQRRGTVIQLPQDGTYDWLAEREGLAFEVECKSISGDKGRPIHLRDSLDLCHLIKKELGGLIDSVTDGLLVTVRLPAKAPSAYQVRKEIAKQAKRAVLMAQDLASDRATITQLHFPRIQLALTGGPSDREHLRKFMEERYGLAHGHQVVAHVTRAGGLILVAIGSQLGDDMIGETMRTLEKAGSDQLTGSRPGILCVKLEGLTADELIEIAQVDDPPTALRIGVHNLWQSSATECVSHVAFMADGQVEQGASGAWSRVGASYVFNNPRSPFKNDARLQLFD
jgi:hypothetical protein